LGRDTSIGSKPPPSPPVRVPTNVAHPVAFTNIQKLSELEKFLELVKTNISPLKPTEFLGSILFTDLLKYLKLLFSSGG
jgi:hypothetical protein